MYAHPVDPSTYDASDPFGATAGRVREHRGSDYSVPSGTVIHAPSDGEVVFAEYYGELGNLIGVAFTDGMFSGLAHNSAFIRGVGDKVRLGEPLALSGATGRVSGAHCHTSLGSTFEAIFGSGYGSTLVNPYEYIQAHLSGATSTRRRERDMMLFHTDDPKSPNGVLYHIITADGREAAFASSGSDFPNAVAGQLGNSIKTDRALLDSLRAQLRATGPLASDPAPLVKAIQVAARSVGAKIDLLRKK